MNQQEKNTISLEQIWQRSSGIINMINIYDPKSLSESDAVIISELKVACMHNLVLTSLLSSIRSKYKAAAFDIELFFEEINNA